MKTARILIGIIFLIFCIVIVSCKKDISPANTIESVTPADNLWQCQIDGVLYSGTIDTTVSQVSKVGNDTTVLFTGTSSSNMNAVFSIVINRAATSRGILSSSFSLSFLYVDTNSPYYLTSPYSSSSVLTFTVNTFSAGNLAGTFFGSINGTDGLPHTITNGKVNCAIGQGITQPKFFSFTDSGNNLSGYVDYARLSANSLIINGTSLTASNQKFKFIIRTGTTIKTGVYSSANGDVGLQVSQQGVFSDYVNDSLGNLIVNITSVDGNIICGTFSGTANSLQYNSNKIITNGNFSCKVINYQPQIDSSYKWGFSEDEPMFNYNIFGGNAVNVSFSQNGPKYYFTLNGESDNGSSVFKIQLSDYHPITTTLYQTGYTYTAHVDSMFFSSNTLLSSNNPMYLYMYDDYVGYCNIDTLTDHYISGTLSGAIELSLGQGSFTSTNMRKATFHASF